MKRTKPAGSGNTEEPTAPTELTVNQMDSQIKDYIKQGYVITALESGYRDTVSKLQTYMDSLDNDYKIHFVEEVYDDYVIYAIENRETGNRKLYKRGYTINDDGTVSLSEDVQEVVRETSYKEVEVTANKHNKPAANETNEGQTEPETNTNDNEDQTGGNINMEKVDKLIQNESTKFTEDDREWLSALSECQLDKLEPVKQEPTANQEPATINQEQAVQAVKEQFKSPDQFLQLLPDEYRDQFEHGLALHNQKREELISRITANTELYPAEELRAYKTKELERLANVVKPKANYSPMGSGDNPAVNATGPEPLLPLGVEVQKSQ